MLLANTATVEKISKMRGWRQRSRGRANQDLVGVWGSPPATASILWRFATSQWHHRATPNLPTVRWVTFPTFFEFYRLFKNGFLRFLKQEKFVPEQNEDWYKLKPNHDIVIKVLAVIAGSPNRRFWVMCCQPKP